MDNPGTVGELAILLNAIKASMDAQFAGISAHLEKLDGLPLKVQALEFRVMQLEANARDRRILAVTVLGWLVAIAAGIIGVMQK